MKEIQRGHIRKYEEVGNGFPTWKPWFRTSRIIYATNPRGPKNRTPMLQFTAHEYLPFPLMNEIRSIKKKNTYKFEMVFKRETMILYVRNNLCNESKGIQNITLWCCSLMPTFICNYHRWKKFKNAKRNHTYKLEMVFQSENHDFVLQKYFMQRIQRDPKNKTPMLKFTAHQYLWFPLMKEIHNGQ